MYYRFQMDDRGENGVYSDSLEERLLEDILNYIYRHPWAEMTNAEPEYWYIGFGYVDGP